MKKNHVTQSAILQKLKNFLIGAVTKFERKYLLLVAMWMATLGILLAILSLVMDLYRNDYFDFFADCILGVGLGLLGYSHLYDLRQRKARPWAFLIRDKNNNPACAETGRLFFDVVEVKAAAFNQSRADKADEIFPLYLGVSRPADDLGDWEKS